MKILLITPAKPGSTNGNRITAERWRDLLHQGGHSVSIQTKIESSQELLQFDCLLALHARRSHEAIQQFYELQKKETRKRAILLMLTGTDVYLDIPNGDPDALASLQMADFILCLQERATDNLAPSLHKKCSIIYQSASASDRRKKKASDPLRYVVLSHLRDVKDPLLPAYAARLLPQNSTAQIHHCGAVIEEKYTELANQEMQNNPRYHWLGVKEQAEAFKELNAAHALIVPSLMEGGANIIAEALVNQVPVLASKVSGNIGMLGADYPAYFKANDKESLADLMNQFEFDLNFRKALGLICNERAKRFSPAIEAASIEKLFLKVEQSLQSESPES